MFSPANFSKLEGDVTSAESIQEEFRTQRIDAEPVHYLERRLSGKLLLQMQEIEHKQLQKEISFQLNDNSVLKEQFVRESFGCFWTARHCGRSAESI